MAHETQYAILMYNLGITYSGIPVQATVGGGTRNERTGVDTSLADIPNRRTLDHVPYCETLDGLVLAHAARAVGATHVGDMATSFLVTAAISSFLGLIRGKALSTVPIEKATSASSSAHPSQFRRRLHNFGDQGDAR